MTFRASAPGKAVLLGEYVVLDGADALVMAVDRRCTAELERADDRICSLTMRLADAAESVFAPGEPSGSDLVDAILESAELAPPWRLWRATIDSSAFFAEGLKLGLGSSAAALVAFAGAAWAAAGRPGKPDLQTLIQCHRAFQGGAGSGIDVAAALAGGCLEFRLSPDGEARIGSVQPPKSVGFAGVFAGGSASTPGLVGKYRRWADSGAKEVLELRHRLTTVASRGCAAFAAEDGESFVAAIGEYGRCLADLGSAMGADLVTPAHRKIGDLAGEMGLAYKVSGAGGGDVGIACGLGTEALGAFAAKAAGAGFHVVPLKADAQGLVVEEHAE
jgi:phosphomevalonate kinase